MKLPYILEDKSSIIEFAKRLKNRTLKDVCGSEILNHNYSGKGNFGQVLEKYYFLYEPNSDSEPDFPEASLELKSSPLKVLKKNEEIRSKERLVLNAINYLEVVNQEFENSSFWKKNANLLLVFYLYRVDTNILDFVIKIVEEWSFPIADLEIIKKDWELIKQKIVDGKAHELSEGDTFYLGACTKGANSNSKRKQPFSAIPAKKRAYSLKQGYVNHIIASITKEQAGKCGKLIKSLALLKSKSIEEIVTSKFVQYYGKSVDEILELTGIKPNKNAKNYLPLLTNAIFGLELNNDIEEFEKANVEIKTCRVEGNSKIKESISFPAFEFTNIYNESWISCDLKDKIEKKFFFIFFKKTGNKYILDKVKFWNMPLEDRNEVRKVWLKTKLLIQNGMIFKDYDKNKKGQLILTKKGNKRRLNFFPKITENRVSHVRPHGSDADDISLLPVMDRILNINNYTKQCFWINNTYVRDEIYLK